MTVPDAASPPPSSVERAYLGKLLGRLVPLLALLYTFCILDRGNVSIAKLQMNTLPWMSDSIFGLGAGIFFVGYFFFEVPSNLIMEKVGARRWIARIMLTWGLVSAATMFVGNPIGFYSMRFLLGVAEAGFYPGMLLYFTYWIPQNARAQVIARFLALSAIMGLIGGPLGGLLLSMKGLCGLAGWQWLFLIEGIPSMLLSIVVWKFLPDNPAQAKWLTNEEKAWIADRIEKDNEAASHHRVPHMTWKVALSDMRVVYLCLIFIISATAGNAVGAFTPDMIKNRSGGTWTDSFVATITIIPSLVGAIAMILAALHSDRTGNRRMHVVVGYGLSGLGYLCCLYAPTAPLTIAALALITLGERIGAGSYWAVTTNSMGARAAAGGLAFINSVGNLGGFFGPVFMGTLKEFEVKRLHGGGYLLGLIMSTAMMLLAAGLAFFAFRQPSAPRPVEAVPEPPSPAERPTTQVDR